MKEAISVDSYDLCATPSKLSCSIRHERVILDKSQSRERGA